MINNKRALSIFISLCLLLIMAAGGGSVVSADEIHNNSMNLTVGENIVSNYVIDYQSYGAEGGVALRYTYNCVSEQAQYVTKTSDVISFDSLAGEDYYRFSVAQAAAQIAEPTTVEILNTDGETVDTVEYSAKAYCDSVINMTAEERAGYTHKAESLTKLCMSIITYAKSAQEYFPDYMQQQGAVAITDDYSFELDLANAEYTPAVVKADGENVSFRSASFICTSGAKLRLYLSVQNEKDDTLYEEPNVSAPQGAGWEKGYVVKNGVKSYYIQINDILPDYFDSKNTVSYAGAQISVSVLDYAGSVINSPSTSSQAKTLAKSLIVYNENAMAYFAPITHSTVLVPASAASCTQSGNTEYYVCEECGKYFSEENAENEISIESVTLPALGHDYGAAVTAPTCTEQGCTTYTCTRCGDSYTADETPALGHDYVAAVTAPTCTEQGCTTYTCTRCGDSYTADETPALGHDYGAAVTAPTCTEQGCTTYTCTRCGDSYTADETPALGHTPSSTWSIKTPATDTADGVEVKTCTVCNQEASTRTIKKFTHKFVNKDDYLYRIGSSNSITLGNLFDSESGADITNVTASISNVAGNASGTFTANSGDWRSSTLKFSGTGIVTVTLKHGTATAATLKLEVVNATNATEATAVTASRNVVLLNDVSITSALSVTTGTLYGNGFSVDATGTAPNGTTTLGYLGGAVRLAGGTLNNVRIIGPNFKNAAIFRDNVNNCFTVTVSGESYIYNSYIFGSRAPVGIYGSADTTNVTIDNTVLDGGRFSNLFLRFGKLNLHNVTTINQPRTTLNGDLRCGYGIVISDEAGDDVQITATGCLKQYNWVGKNRDVNYFQGDNNDSTSADSAITTLFSNMYSKASALTVSYGGDTFINTGILSLTNNVPKATGEALSGYSSASVTLAGYKAWVMSPTTIDSTNDFKHYTQTDYTPSEQAPTVPSFTWSYPSTYSSSEKQVNLTYESGGTVSFNPNILTASKWNNSLSVGITMNDTDYTGRSITFSSAGDYTVVYTVTDPYNYAADGVTASTRTYTKILNVHVTETVPAINAPEFTFYDTSGNALATKIVDVSGKHYVTVDTTAASDTVKASGVSGVYCPVVTVGFKDNSSDFNYLFPIFTGINIKNYTNESGASTTYSKTAYTASSLPSGLEVVSKDPNWNGKTSFNSYARDSTYGLYAKSAAIGSNQSARTATIEYKFTAGNGEAYYYRLYFSAAAHNKPSGCVAEGTLVTMADGSKKPIEEVKQGEEVLTWSFFNGRYEAQPVALVWDHGTKEWEVLTLHFSDGADIRTIYDHGYFDTELNDFAYINSQNVDSYIGHSFIKRSDNGENEEAVLVGYDITYENVGCYSLMSAGNFNFITEDFISLTTEDNHNGAFEFFEIGDGMKYDEVKMANDIAAYGLYTYEDFEQYLSPEQFEALNFKYFKVLVGKGVITYDELVEMIDNYVE